MLPPSATMHSVAEGGSGFTRIVSFTASGLPSGVTASFSPASKPTYATVLLDGHGRAIEIDQHTANGDGHSGLHAGSFGEFAVRYSRQHCHRNRHGHGYRQPVNVSYLHPGRAVTT